MLTEKAKEFFSLNDAVNRGGPEYEYWKHRISEKFKAEGYEVEMEKQTEGHYADKVVLRSPLSMLPK